MIETLNRQLKRLSLGAAYFAALALSASVAITVADILLRHTINRPVTGVVDLTQLSVMWAAFLSIPVAFHLDNHISVVMLTNRFPPKLKRVVYSASTFAGAAFLLTAAFMAGTQALREFSTADRSMILGIPMIWYWLPVVFGFALSSACAFGRGLGYAFSNHAMDAREECHE